MCNDITQNTKAEIAYAGQNLNQSLRSLIYLQQPHHIILVAQDVVHNGCESPFLIRYTYVITDSKSARSLQTRCKQTTDTKMENQTKILTDLYYHYYIYIFFFFFFGGGALWFRCIWKSRTDSVKLLKLLSTMLNKTIIVFKTWKSIHTDWFRWWLGAVLGAEPLPELVPIWWQLDHCGWILVKSK